MSVSSGGGESDGFSDGPALSADGRFVAFETSAANLIGDGSHEQHVLVRDRQTGSMERASVDSAGNAADLLSGQPDITADGRFVAFYSLATNLVAGDTNNRRDIFVRDRQSGTTERVSVEVVLTDALPAEAVFVSASSTQGTCSRGGKGKRDGTLTCDLGALPSGAAASVTIVVKPARAGLLTNTATVSANEPDPDAANNSATETTTVS